MTAAAIDATCLFALIARIATLLGILPLCFRVRRPPIAAAMLLLVDLNRDNIFVIAALADGLFALLERFILRRVRAIIYLHDKNNYRICRKLFYIHISKKMSFEENIKQWVLLDNQLKILNEKAKEIREKRSSVNENIQSIVQKNNLLNKSVQISDGNLKFVNTRVPAPLTYKYLETSLGEIIKNETQVKQIINYLKENREIKLVSEIKRF